MDWWLWVVAGLICLVVEVLTPGSFVFVFFAVGSVSAGVLAGCEVLPEFWQQSTAMVALSVVSLVLFRRRLQRFATPRQARAIDGMIGDSVVATEAIALGAAGKVEFRGTSWTAYNGGDHPIGAGQRCRIERVEGISLWVRGE